MNQRSPNGCSSSGQLVDPLHKQPLPGRNRLERLALRKFELLARVFGLPGRINQDDLIALLGPAHAADHMERTVLLDAEQRERLPHMLEVIPAQLDLLRL